jgi:hypothetical protein
MPTKKRKVILHRVAKTVVKNYTTPEKTIIRDIHVTFPVKETTWLTDPVTYPRWVIMLIVLVWATSLLL